MLNNNLIKGNELIGLEILTLETGEIIDKVKDIIFNPHKNQVEALLVESGGLFSEGKVIPLNQVESIGRSAVIVKSDKVTRKISDLSEEVQNIAKGNHYLTNSKVVTENGNDLGKITDIYFEPNTGIVKAFEVSQGGIQDIGSGKKKANFSDIITVGKDATIVKAYAEEEFSKQAQEQGIQGAINTGLNQSRSTLEELGSKAATGAKSVGEQLKSRYDEFTSAERQQQLKGQASDTVEDFRQRVGKEAKHTSDQLKSKYEQLASEENKSRAKMSAKERQEEAQGYFDTVNRELENFTSKVVDEAKDSFYHVQSQIETQVEKLQQDEDFQNTQRALQERSQQAQQAFYSQVSRVKEGRKEQMSENAVGRYLTKNILLPDDKILARRGSMVTHKMLGKAEENGLLDQVVNNTTEEPIR